MKKNVFVAFLIILCTSCHVNETEVACVTLKVDLKCLSPAFNELFSKIEIMPLETQDSCLLMNVEKIISYQDNLYIFDNVRPALYVFNKKGEFVKQISRKGDGPGEYQLISDVIIDDLKKQIILLSPHGYLLKYDMLGNFIEQVILPVKPNYYSTVSLMDGNMALWSCVEQDEHGISIVNKDSTKLVNSYWNNDRMLDMGSMKPFYQYAGRSYFATAYQNIIYEVKTDSLVGVYRWDFGSDGINEEKLLSYSDIKNSGKRNRKILQDLKDGILSFAMEYQNQNDKYYYTALRKGVGIDRPWINVFYNKKYGTSFVFEKTNEGFSICPLVWTDEYLISVLPFEEFGLYCNVLTDEDCSKLMKRTEDDNLCLVKYYFSITDIETMRETKE